jgi:DnaJ domain
MIKGVSNCRFEREQDTNWLGFGTGKYYQAFYTSRNDSSPVHFTTKQYNDFKRAQKAVPTPICSFRGRIWWWYKLEFYIAPDDTDDEAVQTAIRAIADQSRDGDIPRDATSCEASYARVLGLRGRVTVEDIKRHYRDRMREYHPDKVAALGPKLCELAEEETKQINAAYEFFMDKYASRAKA